MIYGTSENYVNQAIAEIYPSFEGIPNYTTSTEFYKIPKLLKVGQCVVQSMTQSVAAGYSEYLPSVTTSGGVFKMTRFTNDLVMVEWLSALGSYYTGTMSATSASKVTPTWYKHAGVKE